VRFWYAIVASATVAPMAMAMFPSPKSRNKARRNDAGLPAPYSCREGACSACSCIVVGGEVKMRRNDVLDAQDVADGLVLGCQALPISDHIQVSYDA